MAANGDGDGNGDDGGDEDGRKAFLSRIPQAFDSDAVKRVMESEFGEGCVEDVSIVRERPPNNDGEHGGGGGDGKDGDGHRGFGFVTFSTCAHRDRAVEAGTARGPGTPGSSRRRTMYVTTVVRDGDGGGGGGGGDAAPGGRDDACFLWKKGRCPYGGGCKFADVGEGGCAPASAAKEDDRKKKKKKRSRREEEGGEDEEGRLMGSSAASNDDVGGGKEKRDKSQIDCINYKNKGKCRKGADCPYRHDASALRGKSRAKGGGCVIIVGEGEGGGGDGHGDGDRTEEEEEEPKRSKRGDRVDKVRQSLSVRVFGLNYETTEKDVREYFAHCGKIMEVTFPTWEDSGRSKGYCGVLFTSPKAVEAAVLLDGNELHGRWLRVQEGKMYLKKWEEAENKKNDDDGRWESGIGSRKGGGADMGVGGGEEGRRPPPVGEYGQSVKKRKKHGFKE